MFFNRIAVPVSQEIAEFWRFSAVGYAALWVREIPQLHMGCPVTHCIVYRTFLACLLLYEWVSKAMSLCFAA